jgi:hypothetical protein
MFPFRSHHFHAASFAKGKTGLKFEQNPKIYIFKAGVIFNEFYFKACFP